MDSFNRLFLAVLAALLIFGCGLFWRPGSVKIDDPAQLVKDSRKLIEEFRNESEERNSMSKNCKPIRSSDVPASMQQLQMKWGEICKDHFNLVFETNPDSTYGLRVWSIDSNTKHQDKPTKYEDIYSYHYNNDYPISPENIP